MNRKLLLFSPFFLTLILGLVVPVQGETAAPLPDEPPLGLIWEFNTLDGVGDAGTFISMAVQPTTGIPHIAYYSIESGLKLAARTGNGNCGPQNSWNCTLLAPHSPTGWAGRHPALAFNSNGEYGVVYQRLSGINRVSVYQTTANLTILTTPTFPPDRFNGMHNALVYDNQDQSHIWSHQSAEETINESELRYFGSPALLWHDNMYTTKIATSQNAVGRPAVAYTGYGTGFYPSIFHAEPKTGGNCHNGTWQCTLVNTVGSNPYEPTQTDIGLALYQSKCIFGISCDIPTSIFSYSIQYGALRLAEKIPNTNNPCFTGDPFNLNYDWRCTTLDISVGWSPKGWQGSLENYWPMGIDVVLHEGRLIVFYQNFQNPLVAKVMMAYKADVPGTGTCGINNEWHCVVVDDGSRGGGFVSVGFGLQAEVLPDGRILLAYYDMSNRDLIIAEAELPPSRIYLPLVVR